MTKPILLQTGPMLALIERKTAELFDVRRLHEAADRSAFIASIGRDVRAITTGSHTGVKVDEAMIAALPALRIIGNFGVGYDSVEIGRAHV